MSDVERPVTLPPGLPALRVIPMPSDINSPAFEAPIHVGDLVNIYTDIIRIGRTSMTIRVEVYTERNPEKPEYHRVATREWIFVAVDENHRPRPTPQEPSSK